MRFWLLRPLSHVVDALRATASARHLAVGAALGMLVGLAPKDNLTAVLLGMLVLAVRNNLAAAALSALVFSTISPLVDPLAHALGHTVLTIGALQGLYARVFDLPLIPWTGLNNTVVVGSLLIGLLLFYPVYRVVKYAVQRYQPSLAARLEKYRVWQILRGANLAAGVKLK
jgi:uncharacterized protein (TIGR03546 family)